MSIPEAAVNFLLNNLAQIVKYNYHLIADVKDNIQALQTELESLRDLMQDFEKYNQDSKYVENTVKKIRTIIDRAEDVVESFVFQAALQKSKNRISKLFHQITDYPMLLREVGRQISEISSEINKIKQENAAKAADVLLFQATLNINRPEETKEAPKVEEDHVIGFDEAAGEVEKLLTKGPEQLQVVSIVGMLGLGKTTLARKVFKDPKVDYEYMIRVFVYVSKEYDEKDIFLKILNSLPQTNNNAEVNKMTAEELRHHLCQELKGKQFLIILDDIWEKEDWDKLKDAFPNNEKRCRILITTRHAKVAEYANPYDRPYELDFLSLEMSRKLLRWRVFREDSCPKDIQDEGYEIEIADKCHGLPFAIVVIAGIIWDHRHNINWWKEVAQSVKDYIARDEKQTIKVMKLMYKHLPNYLKPCFLYFGVFREDSEIPVWKLIRLWIAEGLIQQKKNSNLEDMAELCLDELVYRNLVMVVQRRSNDKIKTCRMHDTLREFSKNEAAEENLFQEIKKFNSSFGLSGNSSLDLCRRLCLNNGDIEEYMSATPSGKCVRSFLTFVEKETTVAPRLVSCLPKAFKLLRVLEIQRLIFTRFPVDVCNLVLLKYIAISSNFPSLPSALADLRYMQTLIVNTTCPELYIKADIFKMPQFRHLHTNASTTIPGPKAKNQKCKEEAVESTEVQTLTTISPESCRKEVFNLTPNLRKLGISGTLSRLFEVYGESSLFGYLRKLESLENLKLLNDDVKSKLYSLPSERNFPKQLKKLTLMNTVLNWNEMSTIGKIEKLEVLKLKEYAFQGKSWTTEKGGFLRLKHLYIGRMDLAVWEEASVDHLPVLKSLELNNCDKLKAVPRGLADIPSLELVVLHCTNTSVASSARKLQLLKIDQEKKGSKSSSLKLSIYPPEH